MKLAQKILEDYKVEEKVQPDFFDEINAWATQAMKYKFSNKNAASVANLMASIALSLDEVDEKGALKDLKDLETKIKKLEIEK
jgi:hypothetical protein